MAKNMVNKMKGLFMSKKKKSKATPDSDSGSQAADPAEITDMLDTNGVEIPTADSEGFKTPMDDEDIQDEVDEEPEVRAEKTHEKVARLAAEKNTRGYGL